MKTKLTLLSAVLAITVTSASAQTEHFAPATHSNGPLTGSVGFNTPRRTQAAPVQNPIGMLFVRLGLVAGKQAATGRVCDLLPNYQPNTWIASYQVTSDGRIMIFPNNVNIRMDVHSARFTAGSSTIGAEFTTIDLTTGRNIAGGIINMGASGDLVSARIQTQFEIWNGQAVKRLSPVQNVRFYPN